VDADHIAGAVPAPVMFMKTVPHRPRTGSELLAVGVLLLFFKRRRWF
jgi:hypothetical protein